MSVIITLLIYWSIAIGLIIGGIIALGKGFKLMMEGKGKTKEKSSIEFLGLKVTVNSIGALVMITAFIWGLLAVLVLPSYKDKDVEIHKEMLKSVLATSVSDIESIKKDFVRNTIDPKIEAILATAVSDLNDSRTAITSRDVKDIKYVEVMQKIAEQQMAYQNFQAALKEGNMTVINEKSIKLKDAAAALKMTVLNK